MSGDFEAIGTAVEGALVGATVEGAKGESTGAVGDPEDCLNCGALLTINYCATCGQKRHVHRTLSAFWHDIVHSVLHFDGKFWRTLPALAWNPGKLTRRYIHGERAKFISPMALFLFAIFMMFAVFSFIGTPFSSNSLPDSKDPNVVKTIDEAQVEFSQGHDEFSKKIEELETELAKPDLSDSRRKQLTADLEEATLERQIVNELIAGGQRIEAGENLLDEARINTGSPEVDAFLKTAVNKISRNPSLLLYKIQSNGYKFAWLLIPISLPFVWLVMIGKPGYRFYDHAVFTTYSIAFMSLLFLTLVFLAKLGMSDGWLIAAGVLVPPIHLFRQLKQAYQLSAIETVFRFLFLCITIWISIFLFIAVLVTLGFMA